MKAVPLEIKREEAEEQSNIETLASSDLSIEALVKEDNWRAVLVELIVSNKLDPWNIDIEKLASTFVEKLEELTKEGFDVPANLVLACAIVVKFKSLSLELKEEERLPTIDEDDIIPTDTDVSAIRLNPRMPITIREIVHAVEKTLKKIKAPVATKPSKSMPKEDIHIEVEEENIQNEVDALYNHLQKLRKTRFSNLVPDDALWARTLLSVLFLTNDEKVRLYQERVFEDIEVEVLVKEDN